MRYQITVQPSGRTFSAESGETLLDAALREGITLPHGCKNGACGACKVKVLAGELDHGDPSPQVLKADEQAAGIALSCCAKPTADVNLECKQLGARLPVKTLPARIEQLTRAAPDVLILHLRLPATERLDYLAGQYIDILMKEGKPRSFSLANAAAPADSSTPHLLELHIRHVPGGAFTDPLFAQAKVRDILRFNGPHGTFTWQDSQKPAILLAGGTGFAPIKALVEDALQRQDTRPIHVYWGVRQRSDLYLPDLPNAWMAAHPALTFTPVLSEPAAEDAWTGRTGLVHRTVLADRPDLSAYEVYACGAPAMIEAARQDFGAAGLPDDAFFADAFTFAAG